MGTEGAKAFMQACSCGADTLSCTMMLTAMYIAAAGAWPQFRVSTQVLELQVSKQPPRPAGQVAAAPAFSVPAPAAGTKPVGLSNAGGANNCFLNVVVQCLRQCQPLRMWLVAQSPDEYKVSMTYLPASFLWRCKHQS